MTFTITRPRIVTRSEWGARYADGAGPAPLPAPEGVALHHSTDPATLGPAAIRHLEDVGHQRFKDEDGNGLGISYTFVITEDGTIYEGHTLARQGTHTGGHNSTVRAICLHGLYMTKPPTRAQLRSAAHLLAYGKQEGWWPTTLIRGHRDFKATACPGDAAYPLLGSIRAEADALFNQPTPGDDTVTPEDLSKISNTIKAAAERSLPFAIRLTAEFGKFNKGQVVVIDPASGTCYSPGRATLNALYFVGAIRQDPGNNPPAGNPDDWRDVLRPS